MTGIKFGKLLLISTLIMLFLAACGDVSPTIVESVAQTPQVPTEPIATPNDWEYRWLKGIPCAPPCWEGITPGVTGLKEAMSILGKNPLMREPKYINPTNTNRDYGLLEWFYTKENTKGLAYIEPSLPNQPIYSIVPRFSKSFAFSDIIKAYGEPSHISVGASHTVSKRLVSYQISIVYLSKGISIGTSGRDFAEKVKPLLTTEVPLPGLSFFSPNFDKGIVKEIQVYSKWEGFKGFEYYCRDLSDDTGKSDCSKTLKPTP